MSSITPNNGDTWPEPFLETAPEAVPFPLEVFPEPLRELCAVAARLYRCPVDLFAAPAVVLAGSAIGMSVNLKLREDYLVQPHLSCLVTAPPGSSKSPALSLMARPLKTIDNRLNQENQGAAAQPGPDGALAVPRHLIVDDATRESVAEIHANNPRGLLLLCDEGLSWINSLNAYRGGKGSDIQFWLSVQSGEAIKVTRRTRRDALVIARPCIAVLGGITPANLEKIRVSSSDDGWIDRILFSYPDFESRTATWSNESIPEDLKVAWSNAIETLWNRQPTIVGGELKPLLIEPDGEAWKVWESWYSSHQSEVADQEFPAELRGPWAKFELTTARFALILSQLRRAYDVGHTDEPKTVDAETMQHATVLTKYFKEHFKRATWGVGRESIPRAAQLVVRRLVANRDTEISSRDVSRDYNRYFNGKQTPETCLDWLTRHDIVRAIQNVGSPSGRGRPRAQRYEVNPRIFDPEFASAAEQFVSRRA